MKEQVEDVMCLPTRRRFLRNRSFFFANIPTTIVNDLQPIEYGRREERGKEKRKKEKKGKSGIEKEKNGGGRGEKALNGTINICRCNVKSATKCRGSVNVKYTRVYRTIRGGGGSMVCTLVERKQHATRPT